MFKQIRLLVRFDLCLFESHLFLVLSEPLMQRLGLSHQRSNCVDDDDDDDGDDDDIGDDDDDGDGKALNRMFGGKATLMLLIHRSITAIACHIGRTQPDELHNTDDEDTDMETLLPMGPFALNCWTDSWPDNCWTDSPLEEPSVNILLGNNFLCTFHTGSIGNTYQI